MLVSSLLRKMKGEETKMKFRISIAVALLVASLSIAAHASTLYTPPVLVGPGGTMACTLWYLGSKNSVPLTVNIFNSVGNIVRTATINVQPLTINTITLESGDLFSYGCEFIIGASKGTVRASACAADSAGCKAAVSAK